MVYCEAAPSGLSRHSLLWCARLAFTADPPAIFYSFSVVFFLGFLLNRRANSIVGCLSPHGALDPLLHTFFLAGQG